MEFKTIHICIVLILSNFMGSNATSETNQNAKVKETGKQEEGKDTEGRQYNRHVFFPRIVNLDQVYKDEYVGPTAVLNYINGKPFGLQSTGTYGPYNQYNTYSSEPNAYYSSASYNTQHPGNYGFPPPPPPPQTYQPILPQYDYNKQSFSQDDIKLLSQLAGKLGQYLGNDGLHSHPHGPYQVDGGNHNKYVHLTHNPPPHIRVHDNDHYKPQKEILNLVDNILSHKPNYNPHNDNIYNYEEHLPYHVEHIPNKYELRDHYLDKFMQTVHLNQNHGLGEFENEVDLKEIVLNIMLEIFNEYPQIQPQNPKVDPEKTVKVIDIMLNSILNNNQSYLDMNSNQMSSMKQLLLKRKEDMQQHFNLKKNCNEKCLKYSDQNCCRQEPYTSKVYTKAGVCPPRRLYCPDKQHIYRRCEIDEDCPSVDICCLDECFNQKFCKAPLILERND